MMQNIHTIFAHTPLCNIADMPRYSRLDLFGQRLAHAVHPLWKVFTLSQATVPQAPKKNVGLVVVSQSSAMQSNEAYFRDIVDKGPARASPLLFPYTLPSSAPAELALAMSLKGPFLVLCGGAPALKDAFFFTQHVLDEQKADLMIVAAAESNQPEEKLPVSSAILLKRGFKPTEWASQDSKLNAPALLAQILNSGISGI